MDRQTDRQMDRQIDGPGSNSPLLPRYAAGGGLTRLVLYEHGSCLNFERDYDLIHLLLTLTGKSYLTHNLFDTNINCSVVLVPEIKLKALFFTRTRAV